MEEKVLITSKQYRVGKLCVALVLIGLVLSVLNVTISIADWCEYYNSHYGEDHRHDKDCYDWFWKDDYYDDYFGDGLNEFKMDCPQIVYDNAMHYALSFGMSWLFENYLYHVLTPFVVLTLIGSLSYFWLRSYELTVTDKRIYGKVAWGKRVDLPVDSISATATIRILKGVSVSTSSGRISFLLIKNASVIYNIMNNLLIERQQERTNTIVAAAAPKTDEADQLKKYKDLLDSGVITQEEFEAKKKQLLGL